MRINAKTTYVDGIKFDSKKEAKRYTELRWLQEADEISELRVHPSWELNYNGRPFLIKSDRYKNGRRMKYTADFWYKDKEGNVIVEDVKGYATPMSRMRIAIFEAMTELEVKIT